MALLSQKVNYNSKTHRHTHRASYQIYPPLFFQSYSHYLFLIPLNTFLPTDIQTYLHSYLTQQPSIIEVSSISLALYIYFANDRATKQQARKNPKLIYSLTTSLYFTLYPWMLLSLPSFCLGWNKDIQFQLLFRYLYIYTSIICKLENINNSHFLIIIIFCATR